MLLNRNRTDGNPVLASKVDIYLDGEKQRYCFEARTPYQRREGYGYVIRAILGPDGKPLHRLFREPQGDEFVYLDIICEKVLGNVKIV